MLNPDVDGYLLWRLLYLLQPMDRIGIIRSMCMSAPFFRSACCLMQMDCLAFYDIYDIIDLPLFCVLEQCGNWVRDGICRVRVALGDKRVKSSKSRVAR